MIYPIQNNETIIPEGKNVCLLLGGTITLDNAGVNNSVPSKSLFFFDRPFEILAASPFLEGFVIKPSSEFLAAFPDIERAWKGDVPNFQYQTIQKIDSKKSKIQSLLQADGNPRLMESYLHILLDELLSDLAQQEAEKSTIEQFSELIDQNIEQNYCAGTYAEMMGIPLKHLIKEVKKSEDKTPCNFITEKVIDKAKYKLLHTDDTSQMIAYQLGFEDPYYFIKYFKKNTALTPTQFRNQFATAE